MDLGSLQSLWKQHHRKCLSASTLTQRGLSHGNTSLSQDDVDDYDFLNIDGDLVPSDRYELLDVPEGASEEEIKKSYRRLQVCNMR